MRVLLVYDHLDIGGAQTHGLGLARELMRAGHAVGVASRGGTMSTRFAQIGAQNFDWPAPRRTSMRDTYQSLPLARRLLRVWAPDVVHAHAVMPGLIFSRAARRAARRPPIPVVITPHRSWRSLLAFPGGGPLAWLMYQLLRQGADEIIAVSTGMQSELLRHGVPAAHCHLVPNGVDLDAFDDLQPPATRNSDPPVVGTIGRLVYQKGIDVFIEAAAQVAREVPETEFVIAGDGPLRDVSRKRIVSLELQQHVRLLGESDDIPGLLGRLSLFVSASRWEGLPYAVLEAMAARRPVIATDVLGSRELVRHGVTGVLVPPDNAASLSAAIVSLLRDPARAQALGRAGREWVRERYSVQAMAERIATVYQRAATRLP